MFLVSKLRTGCYVKQMKLLQFFNPSSVMYIIAQVNSSNVATICLIDTNIEIEMSRVPSAL